MSRGIATTNYGMLIPLNTSRPPRRVLFAVALLLFAARSASAQSAASVSLGLSFSMTAPTNAQAQNDFGPGLILHFRPHEGPGAGIGFNWFSANVRGRVDGQDVWLGRVTVRPIMAGASWTWQRGRFAPALSLQAGYAFVNIRDTGEAKRAYLQLGARRPGLSASNALAWCSSASVWIDLGPRYGLVASIGYEGVQPTLTTTSSLGTRRQKVNLGSVVTTVGFAYGIF